MKAFKIFVFAGLVISSLFVSCEKSEELQIYSIIHEEETEALTQLFTEKTGIKVNYLRATTGELVNRVIAEKDDPQADILLGGASSYHIQAAEAGALEPYVSPLAEKVPSYARSNDGSCTGFCVLTLGIGINQGRFAEKFPGMEYPKTCDRVADHSLLHGELVSYTAWRKKDEEYRKVIIYYSNARPRHRRY